MKILRYGPRGLEKPGLVDENGRIRSLAGVLEDIDSHVLSPEGMSRLAGVDVSTLPLVDGQPRLGPPVADIGKILAIGLNYEDHAKETGLPIPDQPVLFSKAVSALNGPNDSVVLPPGSRKADWEVELAVIIGTSASHVSEHDAPSHVAGYAVMNDVSEREFQLEMGGQWIKGKSADTFAPLGPWLVTPDEVPDPHNLGIWLDLNGERRQDGNTRTMIFTVPYLVSYVSRFLTLKPGDVITTGTPPGVGLGCNPPVFLKPGDVMELGIDGLGSQRQPVVAFENRP